MLIFLNATFCKNREIAGITLTRGVKSLNFYLVEKTTVGKSIHVVLMAAIIRKKMTTETLPVITFRMVE